MYQYLQFRPDKKESWHLYDQGEVSKLGKRPAFLSVLAVDQDVDTVEEAGEDPLDVVKYRGPMYFDLDNSDDLDAVLESARELISKLEDLGIDEDYIHCWLSGGKGLHITVPETLFGLKRATKQLPLIYKEIAKELEVDNLDMSVYSGGKGRLWRCEHVARPGTGTYKVGVGLDEIQDMDSQMYESLVANDRAPMPRAQPPSNLQASQAVTLYKKARQAASRAVKAMQTATVIPKEDLRKLTEMPGCIEKLITQGDCPESNWNQAAMQVGAWIATRYERKESGEYEKDVIDPFVTNVKSSSRPSEKERRKHVRDQVSRAFSGRTKFIMGPLIRTLGEPCGECALCRGDINFDDATKTEEEKAEEPYHPSTRIKATKQGYVHVTEKAPRELTTFTFWPHTEIYDLEMNEVEGTYTESQRRGMVGTVIGHQGEETKNVHIPEDKWTSNRDMAKHLIGIEGATTTATDSDLSRIYLAVLAMSKDNLPEGERKIMTQTRICGVFLEKKGRRMVPHYIEAGSSIMPTSDMGSIESRFRYSGAKNQSPSLIDEDFPYVDDTELEETLHNLFRINDPASVAKMIGWFAACHMREHIHHEIPQFPLLNIWGNASAGKTMSALLLAHLNGMDYQTTAEPLNMENATLFPLLKFLTTSTTVPRLVEEVNESMMHRGNYSRCMGLFKAAWNRSTAPRGKTGPDGGNVDNNRVSSPIVYVSEQRTTKPAMRNRTIEVMLTAEGRETGDRDKHFEQAYAKRHSLYRAAKAMLQHSLTLSTEEAHERVKAESSRVPKMDARPQFSFQVALAGLEFMCDSLDRCGIDVREDTDMLKDALSADLQDNRKKNETEKRTSEVDRVLQSWDQMAADPMESTGLKAEDHYVKVGNKLKLDIKLSMTRYRRWCRSVGDPPAISDAGQLADLLEGETYFERIEEREDKPGAPLHVINLDKMKERGHNLFNFVDSI